jgi:hypothetical protein
VRNERLHPMGRHFWSEILPAAILSSSTSSSFPGTGTGTGTGRPVAKKGFSYIVSIEVMRLREGEASPYRLLHNVYNVVDDGFDHHG